jgi:hypothetical protein
VHGKEEHDHSGATTPKSASSDKTGGHAKASHKSRWGRGVAEDGGLRAQMEEIEVEREMEKEEREERGEMEGLRMVEKALISPKGGAIPLKEDVQAADKGHEGESLRRVVLRSPRKGRIVKMDVYQELGSLFVLRDIG